MAKYILGIDIGGTNIQFALVQSNGTIDYRYTFKTRSFPIPEELVEAIYQHLDENNFISSIDGIGIGAPNGNYFTGSIDYAPNLLWKGVIPLCDLFQKKFERKAVMSNDANAAAVGEELFGHGKQYRNFVMITLGTGVGSGVIIDNQLLLGTNGYAGEFGHIRTMNNGRKCGCGRYGCLETYTSATGIMRTFEEWKTDYSTSVLLFQKEVTPKEIFEAAKNGDELAVKIMDFTVTILGNALADFACFSDPQAYVLFGGITQGNDTFIAQIEKVMNDNVLQIFKDKIVVRHSLLQDADAALLGATAVYLKEIANL